jgi:hypothetical protein
MSGQRRKALAEPVTILINAQQVIDARGFSKLCVYPSTDFSGSTAGQFIRSLVGDLDSTAHSTFLAATVASTSIIPGTTISVAGNFYLLELATTSTAPAGSVEVHSV